MWGKAAAWPCRRHHCSPNPCCRCAPPPQQIAKNIVLAGAGNVALLDDRPASAFMGENFLVTSATPSDAR